MFKLPPFLDKIVNDFHIPIACGVFISTTVYHFWKHVDLGANYTNSIYAFYAFLAGHNFTNQKWPDRDNGNPGTGQQS